MGKTFSLSGKKLNINILLKDKGKDFFCSGEKSKYNFRKRSAIRYGK